MKVDDALISKLEILAKLKLEDQERQELKGELSKILDMFSKISEVNTDGVEPLRHLNDHINVMRNDEFKTTLTMDEVSHNAPKILNNQFAVPKVIE
jgi:aspartyl-tRNA(Asn)/glutamyl-tRNA(Gln) amidotransferase subunit C